MLISSRRRILKAALATALGAAARGVPAFAQQLQTLRAPGVTPKPKGPLVFLDYDKEELDDSYTQELWQPNQAELDKRNAHNVLQQQARFDAFIEQYNQERPHQALGMNVPADRYTRSARVYRGLDEITYPFHDQTIAVTRCGRICFHGQKVNLSQVFAGQNVGVTQVTPLAGLLPGRVQIFSWQAVVEPRALALRPAQSAQPRIPISSLRMLRRST